MPATARLVAALSITSILLVPLVSNQQSTPESRPRARDLGISVGPYSPGPHNAITDVPGVRVGHSTIISGDSIRTGVTAILPHSGNLYQEKVAAAVHIFNAFGKLVGSTQLNELGTLETPILLTNTLSVWDAAAALSDYMLALPGNENVRSINPVVGETNDGFLNDIRGRHVKPEHVRAALASASDGSVAEGSVGAGTGTVAFGWKGGIGSSSRRVYPRGTPSANVPPAANPVPVYTVGVLVQSNFGGRLTISGTPIHQHLRPSDFISASSSLGSSPSVNAVDSGSCMIIIATDAPLDHRQLRRLAARAILGFARTGASGSNGSGDFVIAFSTANREGLSPSQSIQNPPPGTPDFLQRQVILLNDDSLSLLFSAVADATEEAIYNSLLRATTIRGRDGNVAPAIPIDHLKQVLTSSAK